MNADYEIIKNLRFRTKFSMDYNNSEEDQYESSGTAIGGFLQGVGGKGYGVYITSTSFTLINSNVLTYYLSLNDNHHFNVLLGNEIIHAEGRSSNVSGRLFPSDDFTYINSAGVVDAGGSFFGQNGLLSFFGGSEVRLQRPLPAGRHGALRRVFALRREPPLRAVPFRLGGLAGVAGENSWKTSASSAT